MRTNLSHRFHIGDTAESDVTPGHDVTGGYARVGTQTAQMTALKHTKQQQSQQQNTQETMTRMAAVRNTVV